MKVLLISDTHGHIDEISTKSLLLQADVCIHTGDFGFYSSSSIKAFNQKELTLQIKHSNLPEDEKANLLTSSLAKKENAIIEKKLLGNFEEYLNGNQQLGIPTFALFGNHDDTQIVSMLKNHPIPNLTIVDENKICNFNNFNILGVSGNCIINNNFFQAKSSCKFLSNLKMEGIQCRPNSTIFNYIQLIKVAKNIPKNQKIILLFHPSPMKETFLELVAWQCNATLTISGHMGYPNGEKAFTNKNRFPKLLNFYQQLLEQYPQYQKELLIFRPIEKDLVIEHVNLPDSKKGYGILEIMHDNYTVSIYGDDYHTKLKDSLGESLYNEIVESQNIIGKEYSILLAKVNKIIKKEITNQEEILLTLNLLLNHSDIIAFQKLFTTCINGIKKSFPNIEKEYLTLLKKNNTTISFEDWQL
jgi:Icc-related predicted phosphoesterase